MEGLEINKILYQGSIKLFCTRILLFTDFSVLKTPILQLTSKLIKSGFDSKCLNLKLENEN